MFFNVTKLSINNFIEVVSQVLEIQNEDLAKLIEKDFERAVRLRQNEPSLKVVI